MSSELVALVSLFLIRLGVPLVVLFVLGSALRRWDDRRTDA